MGALDDIAAALRARTGKRVYGTPFYEQKLQELDQAAQGRSVNNEQASLNLEQDKQMFPLQLEASRALTEGRQATTGLTEEKTKGLEYQNSPEYRSEVEKHKQLIDQLATNKDALSQIRLTNDLRESEHRIKLMDARATAVAQGPRPRAPRVVTTESGIYEVSEGRGTPVMGPDDQPLKPRPPAGEVEKRAKTKGLLADLDTLEKLAQDPKVSQYMGPAWGRVVKASRDYINYPGEVNDAFHIAGNLLAQFANAISGAAVSEKEIKRLSALIPDPASPQSKFVSDLQRFRTELTNVLQARQGQPIGGGGVQKWGRDAQGNPVRK